MAEYVFSDAPKAGHGNGVKDMIPEKQPDELPPAPRYFQGGNTAGFMRPVRFEGEITNLEVVGEIPKSIEGTFYRVMPEPHLPSFIPNDPWFNGDGNISGFYFKDGHVDLKQRYVRTEKFVREAEARRSLLGKYRNKYTDLVEFKIRSTANTNIVYWRGQLLALKEDSPPYAMDPETLETFGVYDFDGQLPSLTFTAHPKFDPVTREMVCFGYEAKGDGTRDICYYSFGRDGKIAETVWLVSPVCGMIHDFAVTENFVIFPIIPLVCDVERMKQGGDHWQWDYSIPMYIGVLPRRGAQGSDVKWFEAPHGFAGHVANAFEDDKGHIQLQMAYAKDNVFFWWPDANGKGPRPGEVEAHFANFVLDYQSDKLQLAEPTYLVDDDMEFPRIDDRVATRQHKHTFFCIFDRKPGVTDFEFVMPRAGGGAPMSNGLAHLNHETGDIQRYLPGPRKLTGECIFIPRNSEAAEGDGYVMVLLANYEDMCSELAVLDTKDLTKEVALIKLPVRLRPGLHGNWVDKSDVDGHPAPL
ncbi:carotenoid oxygenase 1 [Neurospora intermedia]|uniref:Carotenoid oxygenase 1 n=1 Tax=Neurospora intermedia TaxID=5142 RepID=A0ABR3DG10_NEUIN